MRILPNQRSSQAASSKPIHTSTVSQQAEQLLQLHNSNNNFYYWWRQQDNTFECCCCCCHLTKRSEGELPMMTGAIGRAGVRACGRSIVRLIVRGSPKWGIWRLVSGFQQQLADSRPLASGVGACALIIYLNEATAVVVVVCIYVATVQLQQ